MKQPFSSSFGGDAMHSYRELLRMYTLQAAKEDGLIKDQDNARDLERRLGAWDEASYRAVLNNRRARLLELADCPDRQLFEPDSYRGQAQTITKVLAELPIVLHDPE
jgi:hypothetical protein